MQKRGQVTIFIILGIVILSIVGFLVFQSDLFYKEELSDEEAEHFVDVQLEPIKTSIENCVSANLVKAIHFVSIQGGYFDPVYYETFGGYNVSYACWKSNNVRVNLLPLLTFVGDEILQYMESNENELESCITEAFDSFEDLNLDLTYDFDDLELSSPVINDNIRQDVNFPISVKRKGYDFVANIDELVVNLESNLKGVYDVAVDVVNAECSGTGFAIDDYFYEANQAHDIISLTIENTPIEEGEFNEYQPWYLVSTKMEEDGTPLKFHFCIEQ
jgi:hypothetical protein